ncbi:MAG: tRNA 2-selenouridine(34) synthase MnmH [Bacteroidetes bacterium]|nr:tRNA 2-selenouridine(34) synthase MnmH [Bacteroidota bacterium]
MIQKIGIEQFPALSAVHPVIDVRSPGEYHHAHIPGAYSLPLFSDEERKVVGTLYKQQSREAAIKAGLDYFGPKMRSMVEAAESILSAHKDGGKTVIVHCWRGGMRSAGVAWLLDLYGFKVYTLAGGYKAFRKWVLGQFDKEYTIRLLGGYTGSGKTKVLHELAAKGHTIIDLEDIAKHKGSAFGKLEGVSQPSQEMFDNLLGIRLHQISQNVKNKCIWIEDESQRIGHINIPPAFWKSMQASPVLFMDVPFEQRLDHITAEYGGLTKEDLVGATERIRKRLGGLNTRNVLTYLEENNYKEAFRILLRYYDKYYAKGLIENKKIEPTVIACANADEQTNYETLIQTI